MAIVVQHKVYPVTMTSGALSSTVADLNKIYGSVYLECPSLPSGSLYLLGSADNTTYRRVYLNDPNHGTAYTLNSAVVANGGIFQLPRGVQYLKVENTSGCTDAVKTLNFIGGR